MQVVQSSYQFWSQQESVSQSWNWRCLLRLRDLASKFLFSNVKNGISTSFWFDSWTAYGPLVDVFGTDGTRRLRIRIDASVADACNSSGWRLPHPRSDQEVNLHTYLSAMSLPSQETGPDSFSWSINGVLSDTYSSSKTWEILRPRGSIQAYAKFIWFSGSTPKHAFHMWITNMNRLPTRSRLYSWGMQVAQHCCICSAHEETRDHLLLSCSYALVIWSEVRRRLHCHVPNFNSWSDLMHWTCASVPRAPSVLKMLVIQVLTYSIWQQRNNMLHNQNLVPALALFKDINRQVINSISALRKRQKFRDLMTFWLL